MLKLIIISLLVLILAVERMNYVAHRNAAEHSKMPWLGAKRLLTDGCPWFEPATPTPTPIIAESTAPKMDAATSGFETDFMAHARAMDARKKGVHNSPAKKMEGIMASNDQAQRKLRSTLIGSGLGL